MTYMAHKEYDQWLAWMKINYADHIMFYTCSPNWYSFFMAAWRLLPDLKYSPRIAELVAFIVMDRWR